MHVLFTWLVLFVFLALPVQARADEKPTFLSQETVTPPAEMSDEALASYISGRLAPLLKDTTYSTAQDCDATGCSVVVQ